jgi:signal peptidase I
MKTAVRIIVVCCLVLISCVAVGLLLVPRLLGYRTFVITGASMTGTISRGSLVVSDPVPIDRLRVGDIITFSPPGMSENETHRIRSIRHSSSGQFVIRTRGDAVPSEDPWTLTPATATLPREVLHVPFAGYVVAVLSIPIVKLLLFVLPAVALALATLAGLWREAGMRLQEHYRTALKRRSRVTGHSYVVYGAPIGAAGAAVAELTQPWTEDPQSS